ALVGGWYADKVGELLGGVVEEFITRIDAADQVAEQFEADHAVQLGPGDDGPDDHGLGQPGGDRAGHPGGLVVQGRWKLRSRGRRVEGTGGPAVVDDLGELAG